jgi:tetratricopeptide (TPR) repeat protein
MTIRGQLRALCALLALGLSACAGPGRASRLDTEVATGARPERDAATPGRAHVTVVTARGSALVEEAGDVKSAEAAAEPGDDKDDAGMDARAPRADIAGHIAQARRALERGDPDRAIAAARAALREDNDAIEAISLLAAGYMKKRFYDRARSILEVATRRAPGALSAELWMQLGLVHEHSDLGRAQAAYKRSTELKPNYARAWTNLGAVHIERGEYAEAASALETALSLDASSQAALTNLGTAYRRRAASATGAARDQLLRKAESHYLAVIRQDADHAPAHLDLGLLYLDAEPFPGMDEVSRLQAAVQHLRQFTRIGWDDPRVAGAGSEYLDEALQALRAAVERTQRDKRRKNL